MFHIFPAIKEIVVCEEKYSFTPDTFKAATREKRKKTELTSIAHLKAEDDIISDHKLSKSAVIQTGEGKKLISNYLARNISKLEIKKEVSVIIDSELVLTKCACDDNCTCPMVSIPVKVDFGKPGYLK